MRSRNRVVHQRTRQQLAVLVINNLFVQSLADTLHESAMDLAFNEQRIDHVSTVIDRDVFRDLRFSGLSIDFHDAHVGTEWKREIRRLEETSCVQAGLDARRESYSIV